MNDSITNENNFLSSGNIQWIKHVTNQDGETGAYLDKNVGDEFLLHFSDGKISSANKVSHGELILLYQTINGQRYFSHLVTLIGNDPEIDPDQTNLNFRFARRAKVFEKIDMNHPIPVNQISTWENVSFRGAVGFGQVSALQNVKSINDDLVNRRNAVGHFFNLQAETISLIPPDVQTFKIIKDDFNSFLLEKDITENTRRNYISWLKYLYNEEWIVDIDMLQSMEEEDVDKIIEGLSTETDRTVYTTDRDISNFRATLNHFLDYLNGNDGFNRDLLGIPTTRKQTYLARVGQGKYRKDLIKKYKGKCSFTDLENTDLLIASHIKPWRVSNDLERLDVENGFLLSPNYDKLFDRGYISINPQTLKIVVSNSIDAETLKILGIDVNLEIKPISERQKNYLQYHYDVFQNQNN